MAPAYMHCPYEGPLSVHDLAWLTLFNFLAHDAYRHLYAAHVGA